MNLQKQRKKILNLLEKCDLNETSDLIKWLDSNNYFIAPASSNFHSAFIGGLAYHSLIVLDLIREKNKRYDLGLSEKNMIISSLLHDVCKLVPSKNGEHGRLSVYVLRKFIKLTLIEKLMIEYHMGPWSNHFKINQGPLIKYHPEILAFHTSDYEATVLIEMRGKK